jgi:DNA invertase Pin-like site-specific DNA recombinase
MPVAGYIRVSTEQQRRDGSHEGQRERLERWASRNDRNIDLYQDIAVSGKSDEREAYSEMMAAATAGVYDAVVVRDLSRFGRSLRLVLSDIETLDEHGVEFVSLDESLDTTSAMGTAMLQMVGVFNEYWSNLARERSKRMIERRKANGEPVGRPRKVDEETVEQIREWNDSGLTYSEIAALVEDIIGEPIDQSTICRYCQTD